jgi:hypothetical protein
VEIWYIFSRFGILYEEKSGNPGALSKIKACGFGESPNNCFVEN